MSTGKKVLIVTGGSRGIGAATAVLGAKRGYAVCVNYLKNRHAADNIVSLIEQNEGDTVAVPADVASERDVIRFVRNR
jgi:NAD(P)-dependent dehydrogenase (short-subunit alcohol dehydrogenase family)